MVTHAITRARGAIWALAATAAACAGCRNPPLGPSLRDVSVENVTLQPTAGNAELCCCRVVGTVTNRNSEPVHVTLKFAGFDASDPVPLATAITFIPAMTPQQPQRFEASGFFFSCARVARFSTEIDVRGLEASP